jgi:hypothetical protein
MLEATNLLIDKRVRKQPILSGPAAHCNLDPQPWPSVEPITGRVGYMAADKQRAKKLVESGRGDTRARQFKQDGFVILASDPEPAMPFPACLAKVLKVTHGGAKAKVRKNLAGV